jgi:multidrug transporter EmrE-like cation transporter
MVENFYTAIQYLIWTGSGTLLKTALSCWLYSIFPEWKYKIQTLKKCIIALFFAGKA